MRRIRRRRRWRHSLAVVGSLGLLGASGAASCSSEEGVSGAGGAGPGGAGTTSHSTSSSTSSSTTGSGGSACLPRPIPSVLPPGWVEYTDWSCDCRFYLPGSAAAMPPPIAWEPCPAGAGSFDCRMMVTDWDWSQGSYPVAFFPMLDALGGPAPLLLFRRVANEWLTDLVAEVDGDVRAAVTRVRTTDEGAGGIDAPCGTTRPTMAGGRWVLGVRGDGFDGTIQTSPHEGALGGSVDASAPVLLAHYADGRPRSWYASGTRVARLDSTAFELISTPWSMSPETLVTSAPLDPEGMHAGQVRPFGDALFWLTSTSKQVGLNVWDPVAGARPFVRYLGDFTRGAADLGTDGVDLVWVYGEGKAPAADQPYPVRSIMTAPFTTDPAALQPRRLRSSPRTCLGCNEATPVGCGYAALAGDKNDTLVVRLSDGWSWPIDTLIPSYVYNLAFGITCDEVYIGAHIGDHRTIVRIRLDSLGPGIAPD